MFGKLTLSAVPIHDHIIMGADYAILAITVLVLVGITAFRLWPMLWRDYLTSMDHKKIGIMYLVLSVIMLLRGIVDAVMMRAQQVMAVGGAPGYLDAPHYNQIFTAHGTIMIIFVAMPFMAALMNLVIPPQIGARDVAFPLLNSISFYLTASGAALTMISMAIGEYSQAGWSGYSPLTETQFSPGVGVDYWLWSLQISGIGSVLTSVNFLVTILRMRAPGMTLMRMPVFTWTVLCTSVLMLLSFPALTAALTLVTLDRYLGMHFFTNELGGNMMMYANLFWLWGHPEVYIVVLPAFGIYSEVVATFSGKPLFSYKSMVFATAAIAIFSFCVWLHHFFTMGSSATVNIVFGIATIVIAVPTGVKVFNWLFTMYRGRVRMTAPVLWTLGFITTFVVGGMTGVLLATPPSDYMVHGSMFLVAHFHNMLIPGVLFGYLAGLVYWFPKISGFKLSDIWGKITVILWVSGFYVAFMPLYMLGFMGMPRRMATYSNPEWHPYLVVAAVGAGIIVLGVGSLVMQFLVSTLQRKANRDTTGDPWDGRTLEWSIPSPIPVYNFAVIPEVRSLDAFTDMKKRGVAGHKPATYTDIHMPRNTPAGLVLGALTFVGGFAMIWHIWWLALVSLAAMAATLVVRSFNRDTEYTIPAAEVERIEGMHLQEQKAS